jgi:hypothetical protein
MTCNKPIPIRKELTMQLEITETNAAATSIPRASFLTIRWGAIFAGLAVGLAANMLFMLLGTAIGLSLFDLDGSTPDSTFSIAASIWNTASMVISAFIGGYVAARGSGLKRNSDGILHAAVAWGMTLLLAVFMASSVTGATFSAMFPSLQDRTVQDTAQIIGNIDNVDRQAAVDNLQRNLGISSSQANSLVDQALALSGREEEAGESGRAAAQDTLRTATMVSIWLTVSTALSLLAALGGGASGVHGARRVLHRRITSVA